MSNNFKFVQMQPTTLGSGGSSIGDTSIILSSFLDINGVALAITDFGTKGFGTIEPSSGTNEEQISFSGITQNGNGTATLTGVKTVLFKSPYTETSGLAKSHAGGVKFVISNTAGFYNELLSTDNDETINGLYTFAQFPITPSSPPSTNYQVANKKYVDDSVNAGAANASTTVKGIVQLPTQAQVDAKTDTGSTGALLTPTPANLRATKYNDYVADTGSASTYVITPAPVITSYATGQQFTFIAATANSANSGVSTLAVNGLAQKTIKKVTSDLVVNDIIIGQVVTVLYDGTNFQIISPLGNAPQTVGNLSTDVTLGGGSGSTSLYPSQSAVKYYEDIKILYSTNFEATGRFAGGQANGTRTFNTAGMVMDTSGSATSYARSHWIIMQGSNDSIINGSPVFSTVFNMSAIGTTGVCFMGLGYTNTGIDGSNITLTIRHIGFKVVIVGSTATLYATQADGTTENASSALSVVTANDQFEVLARVNGTSSVDYYWRKNGGSWSSATNLTTNFPSSAILGNYSFAISNQATATDDSISFITASYKR